MIVFQEPQIIYLRRTLRECYLKATNMERFTEVEESRYQADFAISENFIKFSGELLRLSLLAIGGFGALILLKIQDGDKLDVFPDPKFFVLALVCFVISSGASLAHRYFATDAMSWFISVLRAEDKNDIPEMVNERKGFKKTLKFSRISLITCEISFALGVVLFFLAILRFFY